MKYYIDCICGNDTLDGLSPESAKKDYSAIRLEYGDTVLFKRGSFYRGALNTVEGVTYSAYGEGEKPVFCGSLNASRPEDWTETDKNIWRYTSDTEGRVGNITIDSEYGTFRWSKEELVEQGDFFDSRQIDENKPQEYDSEELLLYSEKNPALYYTDIEICQYGKRVLGYIKSGTVFDGIRFMNSGAHGLAGQGKGVVIRNCDFENIGGCMFYKDKKVRFGNGIEFWNYGEDILIENCTFKQIYDSCITHQGDKNNVIPAKNMVCRNNVFDSYSMAAFEYRDRMTVNSSFTGNICRNAGCGFGMQGEELPRYSEIYPQPMGHHIFLWRIEKATENGGLFIADNHFGPAPVGAAVYSIISADAEAQITFENNTYSENSHWHFNSKDTYDVK